MSKYTIRPDAPGHPDTSFKIFRNGIKVATLSKEEVIAVAHFTQDEILAALKEDSEARDQAQYQGH